MNTLERRGRPEPTDGPSAGGRAEVERAVVKLAHSLAGAGYGVLVWSWPGSRRRSAEHPKTRT